MDINISKTEAFDRWIESLQILAGDEDNPTEEQRGALAVTRRKMLDVHRAALLREVADEIAGIDAHPNASGRHSDIYKALAHRFRRQADELEKPEATNG